MRIHMCLNRISQEIPKSFCIFSKFISVEVCMKIWLIFPSAMEIRASNYAPATDNIRRNEMQMVSI